MPSTMAKKTKRLTRDEDGGDDLERRQAPLLVEEDMRRQGLLPPDDTCDTFDPHDFDDDLHLPDELDESYESDCSVKTEIYVGDDPSKASKKRHRSIGAVRGSIQATATDQVSFARPASSSVDKYSSTTDDNQEHGLEVQPAESHPHPVAHRRLFFVSPKSRQPIRNKRAITDTMSAPNGININPIPGAPYAPGGGIYPNAGHHSDVQYIWKLVDDLSAALENNRVKYDELQESITKIQVCHDGQACRQLRYTLTHYSGQTSAAADPGEWDRRGQWRHWYVNLLCASAYLLELSCLLYFTISR